MNTSHASHAGFTLIEVLVASLLLGLLASILTMIFKASSDGWHTGRATVAQMSATRRQLSFAQSHADNILPRIDAASKGASGLVLSPWDDSGSVRGRSVGTVGTLNFTLPSFSTYESAGNNTVKPWCEVNNITGISQGEDESYIVGVLSYGPDRKKGTHDDITSWPGQIE